METHFKLSEDEYVISAFNDHWITYLRPIFLYIVALGLGLMFYILALRTFLEQPAICLFFLILLIGSIFISTHGFFLFCVKNQISMWVITNKRVVDFQFFPYLQHDAEHLQIKDISEINKVKHGLLEVIFDYGVVKIYSTGKKETVYQYVPKPSHFVNLIETLRNLKKCEPEDVEELKKLYSR